MKITTGTAPLHDVRVAHAQVGIFYDDPSANTGNGITHGQFVHCGKALQFNGYASTFKNFFVRNALFHNCTNAIYGYSYNGTLEHITVDAATTLAMDYNGQTYGTTSSLSLMNSLLIAVTSNSGSRPVTINLNAPYTQTASSSSGKFQTVGAGSHYLATGSAYRNAGSTAPNAIDATLATELKKLTVDPPATLTTVPSSPLNPRAARDVDRLDLGYHYPPLDYLCSQINLGSSTVTLTNGVAVGLYGNYGFALVEYSVLTSEGVPGTMNRLVWYPSVQEQSVKLNNVSVSSRGMFYVGGATSPYVGYTKPILKLRFTDLVGLGKRQTFFDSSAYPYLLNTVSLNDSWLRGINLTVAGNYIQPISGNPVPLVSLQNNLIERGTVSLFNGMFNYMTTYYMNPLAASLFNNLAWNSSLTLTYNDSSATTHPAWSVKDNLFDTATISFSGTGSYSSYVSRSNNRFYNTSTGTQLESSPVNLTALTYASGAFGPWYVAASTPTLVDQGSRTAALAGLYHHTLSTSGAKEQSTQVDVGFHYVAANANKTPLDNDGDGLADYYEDRNGNNTQDAGETSYTNADSDGDGLSDYWELQVKTNPLVADTDGNGVLDADEDSDGDGVTNRQELILGTDMRLYDTNGNGVSDGDEDSDGDLLTNAKEFNKYHTNPLIVRSKSTKHDDAEAVSMGFSDDPDSQYPMVISLVPGGAAVTIDVLNTLPGVEFWLLSRPFVTGTWNVDRKYLGAEGQNHTLLTCPITGTSMIYVTGDALDDDEDGLPNVYEAWITHTSRDVSDTGPGGIPTGVSDGYKDPDGDGWLNMDEMRRWTEPSVWNDPPPLSEVTAVALADGRIQVQWTRALNLASPFQKYVIESSGSTVAEVSSISTTSFTDPSTAWNQRTPNHQYTAQYSVKTVYQLGTSLPSESVNVSTDLALLEARLTRGPQAGIYLVIPQIPVKATAIQVILQELDLSTWAWNAIASVDLPTPPDSQSPFTDGVCRLPAAVLPPLGAKGWGDDFVYVVRAVCSDNGVVRTGPDIYLRDYLLSYDTGDRTFLDGTTHLFQNLVFILRGARTFDFGWKNAMFSFSSEDDYLRSQSFGDTGFNYAHVDVCRPPGLWTRESIWTEYLPYSLCMSPECSFEVVPFSMNKVFQNFLYSAANLDSTFHLQTGVECCADVWLPFSAHRIPDASKLDYRLANYYPATTTGLQAQLGYQNPDSPARWILYTWGPASSADVCYGGSKNPWGLDYRYLRNGVTVFEEQALCSSGGTVDGPVVFQDVAIPIFITEDFYFSRSGDADPRPGWSDWTVDTPAPVLIASVAEPIEVAGWRKMGISNGFPNKYAYLGQYFSKASKSKADGTPDLATQTGLLSEYGEFLPTEPGKQFLITRTDATADSLGTCPVYVIGLQTDVNHDGTMDGRYTGPDSSAIPFEFWVNNDVDRVKNTAADGDEEDDLRLNDSSLASWQRVPDCDYGGLPTGIPSKRDLEDYARLWVTGIGALTEVAPGLNVKLSLEPIDGDPKIRLFVAQETDGGTKYLTDESIGDAQRYKEMLGDLSGDGIGITLWPKAGALKAGEKYIFCGAGVGSAKLVVRVTDPSQGNKVLAEASRRIVLKDIKDMYERWTVGENWKDGVKPISIAHNDAPSTVPFTYPRPTDPNTPYICFVHGWNMKMWEKDRWAETAFKRLYWQGYQGRFGVFRWPADNGFEPPWSILTDRRNYDSSELNAWLSGNGLLNLFTHLKTDYGNNVYMFAHSMGNVVAGEALRLAANAGSQLVNTYVATQAAVPAHAYDPSIPDRDFVWLGINYGPNTPNVYKNWLAPSGGVGRRINFYNFNDYALQRSVWELNQLLKPDHATPFGWSYVFDGYPYDDNQSYAPGSPDDTPPWNHFFRFNGLGKENLDIVSSVHHLYLVMAFAAESRSFALGSGTVNGFSGNVNLARSGAGRIWPVDTEDVEPNQYSRHKWHSAQFRSTNMRQAGYWRSLLSSQDGFGLIP